MDGRQDSYTGALFYLANRFSTFLTFYALQFAVSRGPPVLIQYIMLYIIFLLTVSKEVPGNYFLRLSDTRHI